jgi:hypothetical protein
MVNVLEAVVASGGWGWGWGCWGCKDRQAAVTVGPPRVLRGWRGHAGGRGRAHLSWRRAISSNSALTVRWVSPSSQGSPSMVCVWGRGEGVRRQRCLPGRVAAAPWVCSKRQGAAAGGRAEAAPSARAAPPGPMRRGPCAARPHLAAACDTIGEDGGVDAGQQRLEVHKLVVHLGGGWRQIGRGGGEGEGLNTVAEPGDDREAAALARGASATAAAAPPWPPRAGRARPLVPSTAGARPLGARSRTSSFVAAGVNTLLNTNSSVPLKSSMSTRQGLETSRRNASVAPCRRSASLGEGGRRGGGGFRGRGGRRGGPPAVGGAAPPGRVAPPRAAVEELQQDAHPVRPRAGARRSRPLACCAGCRPGRRAGSAPRAARPPAAAPRRGHPPERPEANGHPQALAGRGACHFPGAGRCRAARLPPPARAAPPPRAARRDGAGPPRLEPKHSTTTFRASSAARESLTPQNRRRPGALARSWAAASASPESAKVASSSLECNLTIRGAPRTTSKGHRAHGAQRPPMPRGRRRRARAGASARRRGRGRAGPGARRSEWRP